MSREATELPALALLHRRNPDELPLDDLVSTDVAEQIRSRSTSDWIAELASGADAHDPVDRVWLAWAYVEGVRSHEDAFHSDQVGEGVVAKLLEGLDPVEGERLAFSANHVSRVLADAIGQLEPGARISQDALDQLVEAFTGGLAIEGGASQPQVHLSGAASALAAMFLELATSNLSCNVSIHTIPVNGTPQQVTFVEVDTCTNRSFEACKGSIDPTKWPAANPFFRKVTVLSVAATSGNDWAGVIKEVVGPGINGQVYETDLSVTYLEQPGLAITAFDLAPVRTDPRKVSVDRGFLSCTDEGIHRRIRTVKVYRIDDLKMPTSWICPLWSMQFALAAWWPHA